MSCGIYQIKNLIDEKRYIGQSVNVERRWKDHKKSINSMTHSYNNPLYRAIRKHGLENFIFEILELCDKEQLDTKEQEYIQKYNTIAPNGYNLTEGGANARTIFILSNEDIKEIQNLLLTSQLSQQKIAERFNVSQVTISDINIGDFHWNEELNYPIRSRTWRAKQYYCIDCNVNISRRAQRCLSCADKNRQKQKTKTKAVSREELKILIRKKTFVEIGCMYQVSDNAIRKWCKAYNLPYRKKDIKLYSDTEWNKI